MEDPDMFWYHGSCDRSQAESRLTKDGLRRGHFLVSQRSEQNYSNDVICKILINYVIN